MSGSLWLKRLNYKYRQIPPMTDEDLAFQREVMRRMITLPPPRATPEELARFDEAIEEADREGWLPGDPRPNAKLPWIEGVRVFRSLEKY